MMHAPHPELPALVLAKANAEGGTIFKLPAGARAPELPAQHRAAAKHPESLHGQPIGVVPLAHGSCADTGGGTAARIAGGWADSVDLRRLTNCA